MRYEDRINFNIPEYSGILSDIIRRFDNEGHRYNWLTRQCLCAALLETLAFNCYLMGGEDEAEEHVNGKPINIKNIKDEIIKFLQIQTQNNDEPKYTLKQLRSAWAAGKFNNKDEKLS